MFKGIAINGEVIYRPQPKQQEFHNAILNRDKTGYRDFLYGGAAKGGKSYALRWEAHRNCLEFPGVRGLLIRSSFPELERTHLRDLNFDLPPQVGRYNSQKHVFTYSNNSLLEFGYGSSFDDFAQYLSANYDFILIDELTTIPFYLSYMLRLRLQSSRKDFIPFWACATNPGNKAHNEVRSYFVKKDADREMYPGYDPDRVFFLPATVYDNEILLQRDPEIVDRLEQLPYPEQQKYLYGNWDLFEGMFFEDFRISHHVIDTFTPSPKNRTIGGLDYGNVTCLHVMQRDEIGTVTVFAECYLNGMTNPTDRANAIADFLLENNLYGVSIVYDTDMEISQMSNIGIDKTPISIFRDVTVQRMGKHNAPRFRVVNKRSPDKDKNYRVVCNESIKDFLKIRNICPKCNEIVKDSLCEKCKVTPMRKSRLYITKNCQQLIKFLSDAIYDPMDRNNSDFDRSQIPKTDHPYDSFKYGFMELYKPRASNNELLPRWLRKFNTENKQSVYPRNFMAV